VGHTAGLDADCNSIKIVKAALEKISILCPGVRAPVSGVGMFIFTGHRPIKKQQGFITCHMANSDSNVTAQPSEQSNFRDV
jgi:hypothetical protein